MSAITINMSLMLRETATFRDQVWSVNGLRVSQAAIHKTSQVQTIGTTYEALTVGADVATAGWAFFRNLDATNFVEIGLEVSSAFQTLMKLMPGECALLPLATKALYARANTAAVKLDFTILER